MAGFWMQGRMKRVRMRVALAALGLALGASGAASAQDCILGEVRMFAGTFAPRGWALANGQLVSISQNDALFSILGTTYGGDGETTFALPDLRGRFALHPGQGPGLTDRRIGQRGGSETHRLSVAQLPPHRHPVRGSKAPANALAPGEKVPATKARTQLYTDPTSLVSMAPESSTTVGGGQSVTHMPPFVAIHHIICLFGVFPSPN